MNSKHGVNGETSGSFNKKMNICQQPSQAFENSSRERSCRSAPPDIRSFCGSLTDVFSRSFSSYFSNSSSTMPTQVETSLSTPAGNSSQFGRSFYEPAVHVERIPRSRVMFEPQNEVQEIYVMGVVPSFEKQAQRGTTNPWRKYGALRKLHEIGGFAPPGNTKGGRKTKENFIIIKKGTMPPPPPRCAEVTLNRDRKNPGFLGRIALPRNVPAEQLSQAIAWEIKTTIESADPSSTSSVITAHAMENGSVAEYRVV